MRWFALILVFWLVLLPVTSGAETFLPFYWVESTAASQGARVGKLGKMMIFVNQRRSKTVTSVHISEAKIYEYLPDNSRIPTTAVTVKGLPADRKRSGPFPVELTVLKNGHFVIRLESSATTQDGTTLTSWSEMAILAKDGHYWTGRDGSIYNAAETMIGFRQGLGRSENQIGARIEALPRNSVRSRRFFDAVEAWKSEVEKYY